MPLAICCRSVWSTSTGVRARFVGVERDVVACRHRRARSRPRRARSRHLLALESRRAARLASREEVARRRPLDAGRRESRGSCPVSSQVRKNGVQSIRVPQVGRVASHRRRGCRVNGRHAARAASRSIGSAAARAAASDRELRPSRSPSRSSAHVAAYSAATSAAKSSRRSGSLQRRRQPAPRARRRARAPPGRNSAARSAARCARARWSRRRSAAGCRSPARSNSLGDERHLVERRRDQPGESDEVDLLAPGRSRGSWRVDHHAEVDHFPVVALQHHADDVLADVVDVALHGGEQDAAHGCAGPAARRASASRKGIRYATARFITRALFTTCGRNILPAAEEVADDVHPGHQRPLDHVERARRRAAGPPRRPAST